MCYSIELECRGMTMIREELDRIGEYASRDIFTNEEIEDLKWLLLRWMYEQRMLD